MAPTSYRASRLAPDGKHLAILAHDDDSDRAVEVYAFATGEKVLRVSAEPPPRKILTFDLAAGGRLVIALELGKQKTLRAYDLATGVKLGELPLSSGFQDGSLAVSPGGKQAAFIANKDLVIVDPAAGKVLGTVPHGRFSCTGMAYSPDGSELAAVFLQDPGSRLLCWDVANGEVETDYPFPSGPTFPTPGWSDGGRTVDWLPDGSAWLLEGHALVNRKDGHWVWNLFATPSKGPDGNFLFLPDAFIDYQGVKLLDDDHAIAGARARGATPCLEIVTIPWPKIDASLKAAEEKTPALLGPGGSISLKVEVGAVRFGTPQETRDQLTAALAEGLAASGITVADGQPVVLHVRHAEEAGPPYRIMGPRQPGGPATVTSTRFTAPRHDPGDPLARLSPARRRPAPVQQADPTRQVRGPLSRPPSAARVPVDAGGRDPGRGRIKVIGSPVKANARPTSHRSRSSPSRRKATASPIPSGWTATRSDRCPAGTAGTAPTSVIASARTTFVPA